MCCIASTDISSLATRHTSPPDSTSLTSMTTSPFLPSYHWETPNAKTLMPSFPSYIPSQFSGLSFISLLIEAYPRVGISKEITSPMKSGSPCLISQLVGASLRSAGWHTAGTWLYRASDASRSSPTCAHLFSRRLGGSCVVRIVRKIDASLPI